MIATAALPRWYATIFGAILAVKVWGRAATNQTFHKDGRVFFFFFLLNDDDFDAAANMDVDDAVVLDCCTDDDNDDDAINEGGDCMLCF